MRFVLRYAADRKNLHAKAREWKEFEEDFGGVRPSVWNRRRFDWDEIKKYDERLNVEWRKILEVMDSFDYDFV